jgi:hypothetical protein
MCSFVLRCTADWNSWEWYSLTTMVHVVPHTGDPACDASRVLVGARFDVFKIVSTGHGAALICSGSIKCLGRSSGGLHSSGCVHLALP